VPLIYLKDGAAELSDIITVLIKKIIQERRTPEQWKVARIVPLFKKGDKKQIQNYRPISNLCSITKVYERLILQRLDFIQEQEKVDLTGTSQHGFKKNFSTETACLEIQSKIARACDGGKFVAIASLDLTAAFDVIDRGLLIKRLKVMGIPQILIELINDWLSNRMAYCEVNRVNCSFFDITHGTIQGSILGPVLFGIYTSPLADRVTTTTMRMITT
jgi:hypothetical protein